MQCSREVEAMIEARETASMMHDIVRSYLNKFGTADIAEFPDVWCWVRESLRPQRQLSSKQRDNLTIECCQQILDRIQRSRNGGHRDLH